MLSSKIIYSKKYSPETLYWKYFIKFWTSTIRVAVSESSDGTTFFGYLSAQINFGDIFEMIDMMFFYLSGILIIAYDRQLLLTMFRTVTYKLS